MKRDNAEEREWMKKEARIVEKLKQQINQKKRPPFLPGIRTNGFLKDSTSIEIGADFVPWRDKIKLGVPERCL